MAGYYYPDPYNPLDEEERAARQEARRREEEAAGEYWNPPQYSYIPPSVEIDEDIATPESMETIPGGSLYGYIPGQVKGGLTAAEMASRGYAPGTGAIGQLAYREGQAVAGLPGGRDNPYFRELVQGGLSGSAAYDAMMSGTNYWAGGREYAEPYYKARESAGKYRNPYFEDKLARGEMSQSEYDALMQRTGYALDYLPYTIENGRRVFDVGRIQGDTTLSNIYKEFGRAPQDEPRYQGLSQFSAPPQLDYSQFIAMAQEKMPRELYLRQVSDYLRGTGEFGGDTVGVKFGGDTAEAVAARKSELERITYLMGEGMPLESLPHYAESRNTNAGAVYSWYQEYVAEGYPKQVATAREEWELTQPTPKELQMTGGRYPGEKAVYPERTIPRDPMKIAAEAEGQGYTAWVGSLNLDERNRIWMMENYPGLIQTWMTYGTGRTFLDWVKAYLKGQAVIEPPSVAPELSVPSRRFAPPVVYR